MRPERPRTSPGRPPIYGPKDRDGDRFVRLTALEVRRCLTSGSNTAVCRYSEAVSVADAHLGAVIRSLSHDEVVVLTSDPDDITRVAGDRPVRPVRI